LRRPLNRYDAFYTMKLIFLHGLPGVGKLTVGRELAKLTEFRVFHNHLAVDLVESIFEFGSQPFVELREAIWLALLPYSTGSGSVVEW
jgi:MoxR-like ATPase